MVGKELGLVLRYCVWALAPGKPLVAKITFWALCVLFTVLFWRWLPDGGLGRFATVVLLAAGAANVAEFALWCLLYRDDGR